jgi:predicted deacylase
MSCASPVAVPTTSVPDDLRPGTRHRFALEVDRLPDGTMLSIPVNVLAGRQRRPCMLAVAGHHGDEHEGPAALARLWAALDADTLDGTLIMVPVLNPPAFRANARRNPEDQVDMNRIFPGDPGGSITHRIAHRFTEQLAVRADFILSMHGWSSGYGVLPYIEFPSQSPVAAPSRESAAAFGLDYLNPLHPGPGRLLTEASARGIPIIEVEIGGMGITVPDRRVLYERGLINLLRHLRLLGGVLPQERRHFISRHEVVAPTGGLLQREVEIGDQVHAGQLLATVLDLNTGPVAEVTAPRAGLIGVACLAASVLPGQLVATVFAVEGES